MKISETKYVNAYKMDSADVVQAALEAIAKQQRVTVDELVEGAIAAGSAGTPLQERVVTLVKRMEKIQK